MENSFTETPAITSREFCSPQRLEQEKDNIYFQQFCKAREELKEFPAATDIIKQDQKMPEQLLVQKVTDIEKALNKQIYGMSTPNEKGVEKVLLEMSSSQREQIAQAYEAKHGKPLLREFANKFEPSSLAYHSLKGLLLRTDSQNSMVAVQLHNALKTLEQTSIDIDKSDQGAAAGFIRANGKGGGVIATFDLISSFTNRSYRNHQNKSLGEVVNKMTPQDVAEMKAEHRRMFRRDIGDMVENTPGLSKVAKQAFRDKGIE